MTVFVSNAARNDGGDAPVRRLLPMCSDGEMVLVEPGQVVEWFLVQAERTASHLVVPGDGTISGGIS